MVRLADQKEKLERCAALFRDAQAQAKQQRQFELWAENSTGMKQLARVRQRQVELASLPSLSASSKNKRMRDKARVCDPAREALPPLGNQFPRRYGGQRG